MASAGNIDAESEFESTVVTDEHVYKKLIIDKDRIIGCIMLGDTTGFNKITKAMLAEKDVSQIKEKILSENFDFKNLE